MTQANDFNFWITQSENQSIFTEETKWNFFSYSHRYEIWCQLEFLMKWMRCTRSSFIFIMVTWSRDLYMTASVFQLLISCDAYIATLLPKRPLKAFMKASNTLTWQKHFTCNNLSCRHEGGCITQRFIFGWLGHHRVHPSIILHLSEV